MATWAISGLSRICAHLPSASNEETDNGWTQQGPTIARLRKP